MSEYTVSALIERLRDLQKSFEVDVHPRRGLDSGVSAERVDRLAGRFRDTFGERPVSLMRAPGRVNIIGEHTDYNDGPVLPAAIDRDIVAVYSARDDSRVTIHDLAEGFGSRSFVVSAEIAPYEQGDWGNYAKAAVQRLVRAMRDGELDDAAVAALSTGAVSMQAEAGSTTSTRAPSPPPRGFDAVIHSTIPPAAGLASSSAFVVLAGCLFASANDLQISEEALALLMADAERYVGTRGGGMDQAAVLLAREGGALYMDFADWKPTPVPLPSGATLIIAHSTVPAPKSAEARAAYNLRAAESHMAAALLRQALDSRGWLSQSPAGGAAQAHVVSQPAGSSDPPEAGPSASAGAANPRIGRLRHELVQADAADTDTLVDEVLGAEPWRPDEVAAQLGVSEAELFDRFSLHDLPGAELQRGLKLAARARHVFDESRRVDSLCEAFAAGDLRRAGAIMDASHESCRDNYEISCPQVDELVEAERAAGALGARMTGAGFGGCTIYLVPSDIVRQSIRVVTHEYYERRLGLTPGECESLIFPVRAGGGAAQLSV